MCGGFRINPGALKSMLSKMNKFISMITETAALALCQFAFVFVVLNAWQRVMHAEQGDISRTGAFSARLNENVMPNNDWHALLNIDNGKSVQSAQAMSTSGGEK